MVMFAAAVVFFAAAIIVSLVVVIIFLARVVVDLFAFAVDFWRGPTRPRPFSKDTPSSGPETRTRSTRGPGASVV
jgi:hypothetical protein